MTPFCKLCDIVVEGQQAKSDWKDTLVLFWELLSRAAALCESGLVMCDFGKHSWHDDNVAHRAIVSSEAAAQLFGHAHQLVRDDAYFVDLQNLYFVFWAFDTKFVMSAHSFTKFGQIVDGIHGCIPPEATVFGELDFAISTSAVLIQPDNVPTPLALLRRAAPFRQFLNDMGAPNNSDVIVRYPIFGMQDTANHKATLEYKDGWFFSLSSAFFFFCVRFLWCLCMYCY